MIEQTYTIDYINFLGVGTLLGYSHTDIDESIEYEDWSGKQCVYIYDTDIFSEQIINDIFNYIFNTHGIRQILFIMYD